MPANPGIRQPVTNYTWSSRRTLRRRLWAIRKEVFPYMSFLTLTYPRVFPLEPSVWKRHLDNLWKRVRYSVSADAWGLWVLEVQGRGVPHYHCVVHFESSDVDYKALQQWISNAWYEVVGSADKRHLAAGTNLRPLTIQHVEGYTDKPGAKMLVGELSKRLQKPDCRIGRFWGLINRERYKQYVSVKDVVVGRDSDREQFWCALYAVEDRWKGVQRRLYGSEGEYQPHYVYEDAADWILDPLGIAL